MYTHILLPTDGSALSESAAESAVRLAKALGGRIIGLHVTPKFSTAPLEAWAYGDPDSRSRLKALFDDQGQRYLAVIRQKARDAGVPCECLCVSGESPYEEIIKTARHHKCDLIYMASHGRKGASALLLGSETAKVLTHSPVPVLVHRPLIRRSKSPREHQAGVNPRPQIRRKKKT